MACGDVLLALLLVVVEHVELMTSHFGLQHFPSLRCSPAFTLGPDVSLNKLSHARRLSSQDVILCREDVWNASHKLGSPLPHLFIAGAAVEQCSVVLQSCAGLIFLFVSVSWCGVTGNTWAFSQRLYGLHTVMPANPRGSVPLLLFSLRFGCNVENFWPRGTFWLNS